ncbi:MAG: hypothetical protein Q8916_03145 [Bacteroidota bacterium]|nr:hypothetical protein [Bacteroidota bacterium]MDP4229384.1 hypothetical protein [Bacteroidota bacterium]MDP4235184.1 hypothetical protein [Bacteroidota bacterium]
MKPIRSRILYISAILLFFISSLHAQEGGYVNSLSLSNGETLRFYISTTRNTYDIDIFRLGESRLKIQTIPSVAGGLQAVPDSAYAVGCKWQPSAELTIPSEWRTGVYEADFPTSTGVQKLIFVVKPKVLGSYSKTLVCLSVNTWQAYNSWGGKSLYNFNSTNGEPAVKVSFDRPFSDTTGSTYFRWGDKLTRWLEHENINAEFCTRTDLDRDPAFLDHYKTLVLVGHDEYWSRPERNAIQDLVNRGGRLIILSGNTCWWQVRFEDSLRTMVCYKDAELDPLFGKNDSIVTTLWSSEVVNYPENSLTGTSFRHGGYVNHDSIYPQSKGYGGYTVIHSNSWIYEKTNLHNGDVFGQADPIVGYEVDGALWRWSRDSTIELIPTGNPKGQAPSNFSILGLSPAADDKGGLVGTATMGYYTTPSGGAVFNAATPDWVNGLDRKDYVVEQITRNVFERFTEKQSFPPVLVSYSPRTFTADTINHQFVFASHRVVYCPKDVADTFVVHAVDPMNKPLRFIWKKGGVFAGSDSVAVLHFGPKGCGDAPEFVTISISNGTDSVQGGWWVIDTTIVFLTNPQFFPFKRQCKFSYKPIAISVVDENPKCTLVDPPYWMHMDNEGNITGSLDTSIGSYSFKIVARDKYNNIAQQSLHVQIRDTVSSVAEAESTFHFRVAPNPFTTETRFALEIAEDAELTGEITNISGISIRTLFSGQHLARGRHEIRWDGNSDNGSTNPAGLYFCHLNIKTSSGKQSTLTARVIKN